MKTPTEDAKPSIDLIEATLPEHITQARELFLEYGKSLGFSLCFQSFDDEVKKLPGAYTPPSGRFFWRSAPGTRRDASPCVGSIRLPAK